jgi:hypothetical protein
LYESLYATEVRLGENGVIIADDASIPAADEPGAPSSKASTLYWLAAKKH